MKALFEGGPLDGNEDYETPEPAQLAFRFVLFDGIDSVSGTVKTKTHLYVKRNEVVPLAARYVYAGVEEKL